MHVFTLGAPRTGTTLLCNLLAADPARRSLLRWEISDLVPPAAPGDRTWVIRIQTGRTPWILPVEMERATRLELATSTLAR